MNREEIAREMLKLARRLTAAPSFNPGDYIMQPHHESPIYGRVIEEQKNGGYKAVLIGGWSGRRPAIKSTKGAHPDFQLIKESDVPPKFKAGIAKKFPRVAASKMKVNDLVEIVGGNPKFKGQKAEITGIVGSVAPYQFTVVLKNGKKLVYRGDELKLVRSQMRRKFAKAYIPPEIVEAVESASSFMNVGKELKKRGVRYDFSTTITPLYMIKDGSRKIVIVNKKSVTEPDMVIGDIAIGEM